jgi:hypothetical protein
MYKAYIVIFCSLIVLLTACRKQNNGPAALPDGSISFQYAAGKDTIQMPLSILSDSTLVIGLKAALSGSASSSDHWVNFAIDTTKMIAFSAKYGDAVLLPGSSYFFYKPMTRLPAGASASDPAIVNIVQETKLTEYTTYVLPVVIRSVDGKTDGPATSRVVYLVFKTGKPKFVSKAGWTIADVSSFLGTFVAANVLDANDLTTYWASGLTGQMPQWITINFNRTITFSELTYSIPPLLKYPASGGYPTSIQIETSMDGVNWVSKGVFAGNIVDNTQTINTGVTTARYVRFTSLASVKYAATYSVIFISGISLVP